MPTRGSARALWIPGGPKATDIRRYRPPRRTTRTVPSPMEEKPTSRQVGGHW